MESPSPVPRPGPLVVKKGSNTCCRTSGAIPVPVSSTAKRTKSPGVIAGSGIPSPGDTVTFCVVTVNVPPPGMASRAFTARLRMTWPRSPGSHRTGHRSAWRRSTMRTSSPITLPMSFWLLRMCSFTSRVTGAMICLRAKARSWRVRSAARWAAAMISSRFAGSGAVPLFTSCWISSP